MECFIHICYHYYSAIKGIPVKSRDDANGFMTRPLASEMEKNMYNKLFKLLRPEINKSVEMQEKQINEEKEKKRKKPKNCLPHLSSFNFRNRARKYAQKRLKKMPKNMGEEIPLPKDGKEPLSFSIAKEIMEKFDIYAINDIQRLFVHEPGNGHFTEMDQQKLSLFLSQAYHDTAVEPLLSEVIKKDVFSRLLKAPDIQTSQDLFDAQERFINVANGVVDLVTGKLKKHDANKYGFLGVLPFNYIPKYAKGNRMPRRFAQMLRETFPDKNDQKRFLQCLAYLISNDCSKKVAFFWVGKPHTGKSTFQRFLARIVGKENISSIPLDKFSDRFSISALFGKKLNMAGETSTLRLKALETFKSVVGNDWINAEYKGQNHFSFLSKVKNLFCGNRLPVLSKDVAEKAVYDRLEFLLFQHPVPQKKQIPFFEEKLLKEEGDLILTVIIRELRAFYKNGRQFTESTSSVKLTKDFKKETRSQDSVRAFKKDILGSCDPESHIPIREICNLYDSYCKANGFERLSDVVFIRELLALGEGKYKRKRFHPARNLQYWGIEGITIQQAHQSHQA